MLIGKIIKTYNIAFIRYLIDNLKYEFNSKSKYSPQHLNFFLVKIFIFLNLHLAVRFLSRPKNLQKMIKCDTLFY